ncbi:hypothetical protein M9Y10_015889 [Tritrichomonas musculus]|uniref:Ankyrin repeat protein n=1 Tax=Tritrichomonas musculus TaxID=1915356 RepID=A0ABR2I5Z9_9EUKA
MNIINSSNDFLDNPSDNESNLPDDILNNLTDDSITTLSQLLSIQEGDLASQRDNIRNTVESQINLNEAQIKKDFLDIISNLFIIENQISPETMINFQFLRRTFYLVQTVDQTPKDVFIQLVDQDNNEITYLQFIPDGLSIFPNFQISENENPIEINSSNKTSYIKLNNNNDGQIKLTFVNSPQNLFFIQILSYRKMTNEELFQYFKSKLNIPKEIPDLEASICHNNHSFKLFQLVDAVQKNDSIICPICHEKTDFLYYDTDTNEQILDYILDDNDEKLINSLISFKKEHIFFSKFKMPAILQSSPSFLSLCAFFKSQKCFFSLLNFYINKKEYLLIDQRDNLQRSPIHFACYGGDLSIIKALINNSNNEALNWSDSKGFKPIHYAVMSAKFEVITYFYQIDADMFPFDNSESQTPLHLACQLGYLGIAKFYCQIIIPCSKIHDFNGFLSTFCQSKRTPLHDACKGGQIEIVKYLLSFDSFAKKQISINSDKSPLFFACESGHLDCVKALLNFEKNFDEQQIIKSFDAAILNGHVDVLSFLVKNLKIKISFIMILTAIVNKDFDVATFLVENVFSNNEALQGLLENLNKLVNNELGTKHPDDSSNELIENQDNLNESRSFGLNRLPVSITSVDDYEKQQNELNQQNSIPNQLLVNISQNPFNQQNTASNQLLSNVQQNPSNQHNTASNQLLVNVPQNQSNQQNSLHNQFLIDIPQNQSNQHNTASNQLLINAPQNQSNQQNSTSNRLLSNTRQNQTNQQNSLHNQFLINVPQNQSNQQNTASNQLLINVPQNQSNQQNIASNQLLINAPQNQSNQQNSTSNRLLSNTRQNQTNQQNSLHNQFLINVPQNQSNQQNTASNQLLSNVPQNQSNQHNITSNHLLSNVPQNQSNQQNIASNQLLSNVPQNHSNQQNTASNQLLINAIHNPNNLQNSIPNPLLLIIQTQSSSDPSVLGYYKNHSAGDPSTFADLLNLKFTTKNKVKIAMQNISMIQKKSINICKSEERRLIFRCIKDCSFKMTWTESNDYHVEDGVLPSNYIPRCDRYGAEMNKMI